MLKPLPIAAPRRLRTRADRSVAGPGWLGDRIRRLLRRDFLTERVTRGVPIPPGAIQIAERSVLFASGYHAGRQRFE